MTKTLKTAIFNTMDDAKVAGYITSKEARLMVKPFGLTCGAIDRCYEYGIYRPSPAFPGPDDVVNYPNLLTSTDVTILHGTNLNNQPNATGCCMFLRSEVEAVIAKMSK